MQEFKALKILDPTTRNQFAGAVRADFTPLNPKPYTLYLGGTQEPAPSGRGLVLSVAGECELLAAAGRGVQRKGHPLQQQQHAHQAKHWKLLLCLSCMAFGSQSTATLLGWRWQAACRQQLCSCQPAAPRRCQQPCILLQSVASLRHELGAGTCQHATRPWHHRAKGHAHAQCCNLEACLNAAELEACSCPQAISLRDTAPGEERLQRTNKDSTKLFSPFIVPPCHNNSLIQTHPAMEGGGSAVRVPRSLRSSSKAGKGAQHRRRLGRAGDKGDGAGLPGEGQGRG